MLHIRSFCHGHFLEKLYYSKTQQRSATVTVMSGFKKPCKYCGQLVPPNSNICPMCGKVNPLETRCPKCRTPIQLGWLRCSNCGLSLSINCPKCGKPTFFGDYCQNCGAQLVVECKKCHTVQPPIGPKCVKCGKPL